MFLWLAYDISDSRQRREVSRLCKQAGLVRIQKSVFLGKLKREAATELERASSQLIDAGTDRLYCMSLDKATYRAMRRYGQDFNHTELQAPFVHLFF